jgi:hypothetical protein
LTARHWPPPRGDDADYAREGHRNALSLAAHPTRPWVAVGIKQGHNQNPKAVVAILAIEP